MQIIMVIPVNVEDDLIDMWEQVHSHMDDIGVQTATSEFSYTIDAENGEVSVEYGKDVSGETFKLKENCFLVIENKRGDVIYE